MKNLFSTSKSPMEQMVDSLDQYSDPCASFIAEGPNFYFGKEKDALNQDASAYFPDGEGNEQELGRKFDGTHSRKLAADYEDGVNPGQLRRAEDQRLQDEMLARPDLTDPSEEDNTKWAELERQADELLASTDRANNPLFTSSIEGGDYEPEIDALDNTVDIGADFDVVDDDSNTVIVPPSKDALATGREDSWDYSDLDDPDAVLGASDQDISDLDDPESSVLDELPETDEPLAPLAATTSDDLADIADRLKFIPSDEHTPEDLRQKLEKIQADIADLKAALGENASQMIDQAMELLEEEAGQVTPTSGQVNGVSVVSKYQDPTSGEVFVKGTDGRVFCVTVGMNGSIAEVKRTSFNPAFPQAYVRTDKAAIDALGVSFTPKL